jgi:tetratricopeptide (TPR) repeat protein
VKSKVFVSAVVLITVWVAATRGVESSAEKESSSPTIYKATELYYQKDLEGSYRMFLEIASRAAAKTNWSERSSAEGWLGWIQERLGNLESANEHYERSLVFMDESRQEVDLEKLLELSNLTRVCEQQGKVGCALATHTEGSRLLDLFWIKLQEAKAKSGTNYHRFALDYSTFRISRYIGDAMRERAHWLQRTGQFEEAEEGLKRIIAEIEAQWQERLTEYHGYPPANSLPNGVPWQDQDLQTLWWELGKQYAFLERLDEAVELGAQIEAVPPEHRFFELGWQQVIDYAGWLAQREGVSQRVWELLNEALKPYEDSLQYYTCLMQGKIVKADLLAQGGQVEPALALLNEIIESLRSKQHAELLAQALKSRARYRLMAGYSQPVVDDLKESLGLYRTLGNKVAEVELYELYAHWLGDQGRFAEALRTWEDAYQLCETLRLHFRSLHMLLGIAELQLRLGNKAELARVWERINKFVIAHKELPEPTRLRLRLAEMDCLKFQGNQEALRAAYSETLAFVKISRLTPYQTRSFKSYVLENPVGITVIVAQPEPSVDIQPVLTSTQVSTGELAHARFGIFNPSTRAARGSVKLVSADTRYEWTPTDQGWNVELSHGTVGQAGATKELTIPPGSASALYFEALPSNSGATNRLSIAWQGESRAEALWEFSASPDSRTVAIINASTVAENPFYAVPFYHELYFRGTGQGLRNLRVKASEPCRVEILDVATDKLLAIDATGDGDFDGPGDVLYGDKGGNGFPDFVLDKERDVIGFELLVYPESGTGRRASQIEISLLVEENGDWVEQAVDRLVVKQASGKEQSFQ